VERRVCHNLISQNDVFAMLLSSIGPFDTRARACSVLKSRGFGHEREEGGRKKGGEWEGACVRARSEYEGDSRQGQREGGKNMHTMIKMSIWGVRTCIHECITVRLCVCDSVSTPCVRMRVCVRVCIRDSVRE